MASANMQQARRQPISLSSITGKSVGLPNRWIINALEGFGKTTLGAKFPLPVFIQTRQETGLDTLIENGLLPETPHFPEEAMTWSELLAMVEALTVEPHNYRTLVIDTLNGAERLCHEHVCERDFQGDWGERGFNSFQVGPKVALADIRQFLDKLDKLREKRKMAIVLLGHSKKYTFKNPEGADYDRYTADCDERTWGLMHKWADAVLFGKFEVIVSGGSVGTKARKGKAAGQSRLLCTQRAPAYDAKNRMGLPAEIDMGDSPDEGWAAFYQAVMTAKAAAKATAAAKAETAAPQAHENTTGEQE